MSRCASNSEGFTTLRDLVAAARSLDMDPAPVQCDVDQLLALGGPAIIGVGRPPAPGAKELRLHFVGLIGRRGDRYLVIDPSLRIEPLYVPRERIARSFTGHAVLLRGCPRPWIWPHRGYLASFIAAPVLCFLALAVLRYRRNREAPLLPGVSQR